MTSAQVRLKSWSIASAEAFADVKARTRRSRAQRARRNINNNFTKGISAILDVSRSAAGRKAESAPEFDSFFLTVLRPMGERTISSATIRLASWGAGPRTEFHGYECGRRGPYGWREF